jgi:hypothetical protein
MSYFAPLLRMSVSLAQYAWPVTFALFTAFAVSLYRPSTTVSGFTAVPWARIAIGFAFPLAILLCGTFWHATDPQWTPRRGAKVVQGMIVGLVGLHILSVALTSYWAGSSKRVVATAGACQIWWSLGAAMVALMAVSGDWL